MRRLHCERQMQMTSRHEPRHIELSVISEITSQLSDARFH